MDLVMLSAFALLFLAGLIGFIGGAYAVFCKIYRLVGPEEWERIRRQW
jgi:hypothetical protein